MARALLRSRGAVALLLLLTACSSNLEAGVNVKSVTTDLVYGIPVEEVPAAPANIGTPPDEPVGIVQRSGGSQRNDPPPPATTPPPPECPAARPDEFPEPALSRIQGKPKIGEYMWRVDGTENTARLGKIKLPRSTRKQITAVLTTEGTNFQYAITEEDLRFGARSKIKTTYDVRHDDGIYLTKIERETEGGAKSVFQPTPAVEVFPLPAQIGAEVNSTGIDANTLEILRVTGSIPERKRIDACGDPVDAFRFDGVQEFVSASGEASRRHWDIGVATAIGGLIVYEAVEAPCQSDDENGKCTPEATLVFESHIGQLEPDDLEG